MLDIYVYSIPMVLVDKLTARLCNKYTPIHVPSPG